MLRNILRRSNLSAFKNRAIQEFKTVLRQNYENRLLPLNKIIASTRSLTPSAAAFKNAIYNSIVEHNKRQEYFYMDLPNCRPVLEYELNKKIVTILHTEVPRGCSGKGYGKQLADAILMWIATNNYRMIIECEFVKNYVHKHRPEFKKFLIK